MILDATSSDLATLGTSPAGEQRPALLMARTTDGHASLFIVHPVAVFAATCVLTILACAVCLAMVDAPVAHVAASSPVWLRQTARYVTVLGTSGYMIAGATVVIAASWLALKRTVDPQVRTAWRSLRARASYVLACVVVSGILVQLVKHMVGRARPKLLDTLGTAHFDLFSIKASLASFPSGHATSIVALAVALGLLAPPVGRWLLLVAFAVGASRVIVGAHYASDVLGGAALGLLVSLGLAIAFADRDIVFSRTREVLRVKARGSVWPVLRGTLGRSRP